MGDIYHNGNAIGGCNPINDTPGEESTNTLLSSAGVMSRLNRDAYGSGSVHLRRFGNIVVLYSTTWIDSRSFTIPEGFRPIIDVFTKTYQLAADGSASDYGNTKIKSTGIIENSLYPFFAGCITWGI